MNELKQTPEKTSSTFCVCPWIEISLFPNSYLFPCCVAKPLKDEKGRVYNLIENTLEDYWNSWDLKEVRRKMLAGEKIDICHWCYHEESVGMSSMRQNYNVKWLKAKEYKGYREEILERVEKSKMNDYRVEEPPLHLDVRPSNLCNLKCRMCFPSISSKIEQEQREMLKNNIDTSFIDVGYLKKDRRFINWQKNKEVWKTLYKWIPGLKKLDFLGGEPSLIKENWNLINYLREKGYSKDIELEFSINCTQNPYKFIEIFQDFRSVIINFSLDGYQEVNDYIRYPSKWKIIESNVIKMLKNKIGNVYFCFTPVVQVYNILDLPQLLKWIFELKLQYKDIGSFFRECITPDFLNIGILPKNIKQKALLQIEECKDFCEDDDGLCSIKTILNRAEKPGIEKDLKKFYKYTKILDQYRNNSFKKTFPEFNNLLNEDGRWLEKRL